MRSTPSRDSARAPTRSTTTAADCCPRLSPPCRLPCFERGDEPADERPERLLERTRHLVDHGLAGEDVPLHRKAGARLVSCPVETRRARERRRTTIGRHDPELARLPLRVVGEHACERLVGLGPRGELLERAPAVDGDAGGLRGDRSDAGARPWDDGADREVLRLHGASHLTCLQVGRDDRERSAFQHQWLWRSR